MSADVHMHDWRPLRPGDPVADKKAAEAIVAKARELLPVRELQTSADPETLAREAVTAAVRAIMSEEAKAHGGRLEKGGLAAEAQRYGTMYLAKEKLKAELGAPADPERAEEVVHDPRTQWQPRHSAEPGLADLGRERLEESNKAGPPPAAVAADLDAEDLARQVLQAGLAELEHDPQRKREVLRAGRDARQVAALIFYEGERALVRAEIRDHGHVRKGSLAALAQSTAERVRRSQKALEETPGPDKVEERIYGSRPDHVEQVRKRMQDHIGLETQGLEGAKKVEPAAMDELERHIKHLMTVEE